MISFCENGAQKATPLVNFPPPIILVHADKTHAKVVPLKASKSTKWQPSFSSPFHNSRVAGKRKRQKKENFMEDGPAPLEFVADSKDLPSRLKGLPCGKYLGLLLLVLLTSITISLTNLVAKSMSDYHAFSLVLWRLQGVALPSRAVPWFCPAWSKA